MFRFRKLKISTSLYLLLMMFCVMQVISSGISLGIIHLNNNQITRIDLDTAKRDELGLSWVSLVQARNAINRVAIGMKTEQSTDYIQSIESIALSRLEPQILIFKISLQILIKRLFHKKKKRFLIP